MSGRVAVVMMAVAFAACASAPPAQSVQLARRAHYDVGIDVVYATAVAAVRAKSQHVEEDAVGHRVRTAWSSIGLEQAEGSFPSGGGGMGPGPPGGTRSAAPGSRHPHAYRFVRVDLEILGTRPYEVRVIGHASRMVQGATAPEPIADEPSWLTKYVDDIRLAIYERLRPYAR